MKFLQSRFTVRTITAFLLLVFIQSVFMPYYSFALTSGPHQPEFTSYEDAGSTDMVNLITGDFNFNIPIMEVPGPEGNFALPLSYHASIGLEQESSWCGLGVSISAGAINREINQYPDDASGEINYITAKNLTGITGWNRTFNHPFRDDWNSQNGYHGNVNLLDIVEVDFGNKTSVGIVGVHVGDGGVSFDPVQFGMAISNIASFGVGSVGTTSVSVAKQMAIDLAYNTAVSFVMAGNAQGSQTAGSWGANKSSKNTSFEFNHNAKLSFLLGLPIHSIKKSWKIWLDQTRSEQMYGILNFGKVQPVGLPYNILVNGNSQQLYGFLSPVLRGAASDINYTLTSGPYSRQNPTTVLANDTYVVNASGVSGSIKPYRLEVGSVGLIRNMDAVNHKYYPIPYLNNYRVPFIYEGGISNEYFFHVGNNSADPNILNYGMDFNNPSDVPGSWVYKLDDAVFSGDRIRSDLKTIKKIPQGNNVDWLTNHEIVSNLASSQTCPNKFIDFLSGAGADFTQSDRYKFRTDPTLNTSSFTTSTEIPMTSFKTKIPIADEALLNLVKVGDPINLRLLLVSNGGIFNLTITSKDNASITVSTDPDLNAYLNTNQVIKLTYVIVPKLDNALGGYCITSPEGLVYHFSLPVYSYDERSQSILIADNNKSSTITRYAPFASTWLLTAITGSDFIDRNSNGLADDSDWGYWVKMNYGQYVNDYQWRTPYTNEMIDPTNVYKSYEKGKKQLYYLNSIETRSHVALFLKGTRNDGLDAGKSKSYQKLDEICLLKKEHYKKLLLAPYNIPDYSNKILPFCSSNQFSETIIRDYINRNCLKRIIFNYDYSLCKKTPNTLNSDPQRGKLTLKGITIKGRNDLKVVPDYKFEYSNNPDYNANYWDGWGMYNSSGTTTPSSHATNDSGDAGSAWSLTRVSTPLGTDLIIRYERDTYSSISGETILGANFAYSQSAGPVDLFQMSSIPRPISSPVNYSVGDKVRISGQIEVKCYSTSSDVKEYSGDFTIVDVSPTEITLDHHYIDLGSTCNGNPATILAHSGAIAKIDDNKAGGNLRVASIVMQDEFGKQNKLRYLYTKDDGSSSGVVAQEPNYIKTKNFPFYDYLKYPQTPVIYGKVSVLSGKLTTDTDFDSRQVFEFETPNKMQLVFSSQDQGSSSKVFKNLFRIDDHTSKIGKLNSIATYDKTGMLSSTTKLIYTDTIVSNGLSNVGVFSEGNLFVDYSFENGGQAEDGVDRINRTTVLSYPYTLKKIVNSKDGFTSSTENLDWDLLTGVVTQKLDKTGLGVYVKTVTKPAYTFYPELGSKAYNVYTGSNQVDNRNMLLQNAATYVYRSDALGNALGLISANVQTWRNDWANYRHHNGTDYADEGTQTNKVWRKGPAYVWKGTSARLQRDYGTHSFSAADEFNFAGTNPLWQYAGEYKRFDHYGMPLESVDMNGLNSNAFFSSLKMGYDNRVVIASAANARYNEIAFSSAEDKIANIPYFGGEVGLGSGTMVSSPVHTGNTALSVTSGYGFVFKSSELNPSKSYRVSVWANSTNGRIYYKLNGGSEVVPATQTISSPVAIPGMGSWYRIDLTIPNPATSVIEVGVKSNSGTVVLDDFRFQPADAVMTCYVYPPLDFEFTASSPTYSIFSYVLDNNNLFTKYETNEKGQLIKTYSESLTNGVQLITESKNNLRRFNTGE